MRILNSPLKHGSIFETSIFYLPLGDSLYSLYTFMKTSIVIVNHQNRWIHMNTHQLVMFHLELEVSNFQHVYNPLPSGLGKVTQCQTPCHNPNFGVWFLHETCDDLGMAYGLGFLPHHWFWVFLIMFTCAAIQSLDPSSSQLKHLLDPLSVFLQESWVRIVPQLGSREEPNSEKTCCCFDMFEA